MKKLNFLQTQIGGKILPQAKNEYPDDKILTATQGLNEEAISQGTIVMMQIDAPGYLHPDWHNKAVESYQNLFLHEISGGNRGSTI